jgi:hypothetical protein
VIVLDLSGFRKVSLQFEEKPSKGELMAAVQAGYSFDTKHVSYRSFHGLVNDALQKLRQVNAEYVLIMSSYHRFNDACGDDDWRAVQIDDYRVNNGTYFQRSPDVNDARYKDGILAYSTIEDLEINDWRGLFRDINGLDRSDGYYPREFGLLMTNNKDYLVLGDSVNGDGYGAVYRINGLEGFEWEGTPGDPPSYSNDLDDMVDLGKHIDWQNVDFFADITLAGWEKAIPRQENERLKAGTIDIPDVVRDAALRYLAEGNPLMADKVVSDGLGFWRHTDAWAWTKAVVEGPRFNELSPSYLQEACELVRSGNISGAAPLLMKNAELSEREAGNWIETYIDHLALSSLPKQSMDIGSILVRSGNISGAAPSLMKNAGFSAREARNRIETYIDHWDHWAVSSPPKQSMDIGSIIARLLSRWRK